jgi:hypothetical protein
MRGLRLVLTVVVLVLVALGIGFGWGASGRLTAQRVAREASQQLDLAEARGRILEARVSLYNVNFGDAQRQLEEAKGPLTRARDRALDQRQRQTADALSAALTHAQEAQRLASRLDQGANTRAGEALKAIDLATSK